MSPTDPPCAGQEPRREGIGDGFDPAAVSAAARRRDPGLPAETADLLAAQAWPSLLEIAELDAPGLARALLAANPEVGATACNVVAAAAVALCEQWGRTP